MQYKVIEQDENNHFLIEEPSETYVTNGQYTYANYFSWKIEERLELIKGWIFKMSALNLTHQSISMNLSVKFSIHLSKSKCKVFAAPFDVRLTKNNKIKDEEVKQ